MMSSLSVSLATHCFQYPQVNKDNAVLVTASVCPQPIKAALLTTSERATENSHKLTKYRWQLFGVVRCLKWHQVQFPVQTFNTAAHTDAQWPCSVCVPTDDNVCACKWVCLSFYIFCVFPRVRAWWMCWDDEGRWTVDQIKLCISRTACMQSAWFQFHRQKYDLCETLTFMPKYGWIKSLSQPWTSVDVTGRSCMWEQKLDRTLNGLYPASSLVQRSCNVRVYDIWKQCYQYCFF